MIRQSPQLAVALATSVAFATTGAQASDALRAKSVCDRIAALGPTGLTDVLIPEPSDGAALVIDIDGDKSAERLSSRWEITSMRPRLWFVQTAKGEPYLGHGTRSLDFEQEKGSVLFPESGYETVWIKLNGEVFALGMYDERHVIATDLTQFAHGKAKLLCKFDHTTTVEWRSASATDQQTCRAATAGEATSLSFEPVRVDWQKGLRATMLEIQGAGKAETDLDRDGKSDALVRWEFQSGAGRGCSLKWIDVHPDRPDVTLRKLLLDAQGFQMDPAGQYSYYPQMLPRDEFGWSRCGDVNEIVNIEGRTFVNANNELTSLDGRVARVACQGRTVTQWRVKE